MVKLTHNMTKTNTYTALFAAFGFVVLALLAAVYYSKPGVALGSIVEGQAYMATTTAANSLYGATVTGSRLIRTGSGSLGSVVITGANTGVVNFYNATTSDITKRATSMSTSTILIATFPASTVAGTYVFDAVYDTGLYVDLISGNMPTSTITYR